ncbi:MAG: branched-chain amino acid ABC transporter permease [Rhodospirillaceae bacterium]|nr:branched-chain amino acid ABC transporter permease [Rhodospirillaceae bacterium]
MEVLQLLIGGVAQGCVYGLIALGFVLIYKATEQVNFAQGDVMMLGAYVALTLIAEARAFGWDVHLAFWLALPLTMLVMAAFGYLLDRVALRPVIGQPQFAVVILTIALGFVFRAAAGAIWTTEPQTLATPFTGKKIVLFGAVLGAESLAIIAGTVLLSAVLYAFFRYTRLGMAMQAASQNQLAAYYMGVPVKLVFSLVWAISAGVAAAAGILLAPISTIDPQMGFIGLKAFAAAVIGGFGSLPGALIAGLMLGAIEPFASAYGSRAGLPKGVPEVSSYILMLVVLILRPQGLFAQIHRKKV